MKSWQSRWWRAAWHGALPFESAHANARPGPHKRRSLHLYGVLEDVSREIVVRNGLPRGHVAAMPSGWATTSPMSSRLANLSKSTRKEIHKPSAKTFMRPYGCHPPGGLSSTEKLNRSHGESFPQANLRRRRNNVCKRVDEIAVVVLAG